MVCHLHSIHSLSDVVHITVDSQKIQFYPSTTNTGAAYMILSNAPQHMYNITRCSMSDESRYEFSMMFQSNRIELLNLTGGLYAFSLNYLDSSNISTLFQVGGRCANGKCVLDCQSGNGIVNNAFATFVTVASTSPVTKQENGKPHTTAQNFYVQQLMNNCCEDSGVIRPMKSMMGSYATTQHYNVVQFLKTTVFQNLDYNLQPVRARSCRALV